VRAGERADGEQRIFALLGMSPQWRTSQAQQ
jgi:hypothetical protein